MVDVNGTDKPVMISDSTFEQTMDENPLVVVDFWAPWCGPCRMMSPVIEELAGAHQNKIVFGKVNVDENPKIATQFGIISIPTLLVMKDGQEVDRIVGFAPKDHLSAYLKQYT